MFSANLSIKNQDQVIKLTHVYVTEVMQNKYRACILSTFLWMQLTIYTVQLAEIIKLGYVFFSKFLAKNTNL